MEAEPTALIIKIIITGEVEKEAGNSTKREVELDKNCICQDRCCQAGRAYCVELPVVRFVCTKPAAAAAVPTV